MAVIASSCIATVAQLLCWLGGADPWGGASLSLHSLKAAGVGALASIPLVLLNYYLWTSPRAREQLPFLDEVQSKQVEDFGPMIDGLSPLQLQAFMVAETLPGVLMTYCAGAGLIAHLIHTAADFVANGGSGSFGDLGELAAAAAASSSSSSSSFSIMSSLPPLAPEAVGLAVAASLAGVARGSEIAASEAEYEVIRDAIENAERYYRVAAMGKDSTVVDATEASTTFVTVAIRWMANKQVAAKFAAAMTVVEVVYLGGVWLKEEDLMAPMVAMLIVSGVVFDQIRRRRTGSGSGSSTETSM